MIVVLDASAAVRAAMDPSSQFHDSLRDAKLAIGPELVIAEVCNAFRNYVRARQMTAEEAAQSVEIALSLIDRMRPMAGLVPDVLALATRFNSPVYDLFYLALALQTGGTLLTADIALQRKAVEVGVAVC